MTDHGDDLGDPALTGPARPPRRPGADRERPVDAVGEPGAMDADLDPDLFDDDLFTPSDTSEEPGDRPREEAEWDEDLVDLPSPGSARRWVIVIGVLILLVGVTVGAGWRWYQHQIDPPGGPGAAVEVEIPTGSSLNAIAALLEDEGIITSARVFQFYARNHDTSGFQSGTYQFNENSSFDRVLDRLAAGPGEPTVPDVLRVSLPEGLVLSRILERIDDAVDRFERGALDQALAGFEIQTMLRPDDVASYEGLLFPATYDIAEEMTEATLLARMADEMESRVTRLDPDASLARINSTYGLDLDRYDLMIVASMVQAEAGNPDEAPQIATVIYNRLAQDMALQIDAVDRYGAELAGAQVDYNDASLPYNSRRRAGLPPTAIAAPGDYALRAAFEPAQGDWLYYVLVEPRAHLFTADYDEFLAGKQTCIEADLGCG